MTTTEEVQEAFEVRAEAQVANGRYEVRFVRQWIAVSHGGRRPIFQGKAQPDFYRLVWVGVEHDRDDAATKVSEFNDYIAALTAMVRMVEGGD